MKTRRQTRAPGFAQESDIITKIEGMDVEFDEKVTLFPVELEEIRDVVAKRSSPARRGGRSMH